MIDGFTFLSEHEPPYLLHCLAGRDRTGFAIMILEMLGNASKGEIIVDYMKTWEDCYGVEKESAVWNLIRDRQVGKWIDRLISEYGDGNEANLATMAKNYLLWNGMNPEKLDMLLRKLIQ